MKVLMNYIAFETVPSTCVMTANLPFNHVFLERDAWLIIFYEEASYCCIKAHFPLFKLFHNLEHTILSKY